METDEGTADAPSGVLQSTEQQQPAEGGVETTSAAADGPKTSKNQHKKKGTAKALTKAKRGGGSKAGGAASKKSKGGDKSGSNKKKQQQKKKTGGEGDGAAAGEGEEAAAGEEEEDDDESESESDQGTYCICKGPDDHRWMICCDGCQDWFHGDCVGMDKYVGENLVQQYICPRCADPAARRLTRYKKLCSLEGCARPSRAYADSPRDASVFCSKEHCDAWWDQMVATLPRRVAAVKGGGAGDALTQADFVGLLDRQAQDAQKDGGWKLGEPAFLVDKQFWDTHPAESVLTHEELALVTASTAQRQQLQEEILLCKKQLQLLDMAAERRKQLIAAAGASSKDMCGYDHRLDDVGAPAAFAAFERSPHGAAIFVSGSLDTPAPESSTDASAGDVAMENGDVGEDVVASKSGGSGTGTGGGGDWVCRTKRCKPHAAWYNGMVKSVRHTMKQLAAEVKEKLEAETRVRDCAAVRYQRKERERNWVEIMDED